MKEYCSWKELGLTKKCNPMTSIIPTRQCSKFEFWEFVNLYIPAEDEHINLKIMYDILYMWTAEKRLKSLQLPMNTKWRCKKMQAWTEPLQFKQCSGPLLFAFVVFQTFHNHLFSSFKGIFTNSQNNRLPVGLVNTSGRGLHLWMLIKYPSVQT